MNLDQIIASMADKQEAQTLTKTASTLVPRVSNPQAFTDPVAGLLKMAQELVASEKTAEAEHLSLLGAAFADAAINRFAAYDAMTKQAGVNSSVEANAEAIYEKAAELGYQDMCNQFNADKTASDAQAQEDYMFKQAAINEAMQFAEVYEAELQKNAAIDEAVQFSTENTKQAEFDAGVADAVAVIADAAQREFFKGAATAQIMIEHLSKGR